MAEIRKKNQLVSLCAHTQTHMEKQAHSVWLLFLLVYDLTPPPFTAELTAEGWVAGAIVPGLRWARTTKSHNTN